MHRGKKSRLLGRKTLEGTHPDQRSREAEMTLGGPGESIRTEGSSVHNGDFSERYARRQKQQKEE